MRQVRQVRQVRLMLQSRSALERFNPQTLQRSSVPALKRSANVACFYGRSLFSSGLAMSRGPTVPRRAFSDCGCPVRMAAYIVVFDSTFFT